MNIKRKIWAVVIISGMLAVILSAMVYRELRQERLNGSLIEAVKRNDAQKVTVLLSQGADANARDLPPDNRSFWQRLQDVFQRKHAAPEEAPAALIMAIEVACATSDTMMDEALIERRNSAVFPYTPAIVKMLLDHGANIQVKDRYGWSPLVCAATYGQWEIMHLLLDKNAPVEGTNGDGDTPLILAAQAGQTDLVKRLLEGGADIHFLAQDDTALHVAARFGDVASLRLMLDRGADVNLRNRNGATPLIAAVEGLSAHTEDGRLVRCPPERFKAVASVAAFLLSRGADVNATDRYGTSALTAALFNEWDAAADTILKYRVDVKHREKIRNITPLIAAAERGNLRMVKALIARGATQSVREALWYAQTYGHKEVARYLKTRR